MPNRGCGGGGSSQVNYILALMFPKMFRVQNEKKKKVPEWGMVMLQSTHFSPAMLSNICCYWRCSRSCCCSPSRLLIALAILPPLLRKLPDTGRLKAGPGSTERSMLTLNHCPKVLCLANYLCVSFLLFCNSVTHRQREITDLVTITGDGKLCFL